MLGYPRSMVLHVVLLALFKICSGSWRQFINIFHRIGASIISRALNQFKQLLMGLDVIKPK